jgi:hypothetical protein
MRCHLLRVSAIPVLESTLRQSTKIMKLRSEDLLPFCCKILASLTKLGPSECVAFADSSLRFGRQINSIYEVHAYALWYFPAEISQSILSLFKFLKQFVPIIFWFSHIHSLSASLRSIPRLWTISILSDHCFLQGTSWTSRSASLYTPSSQTE